MSVSKPASSNLKLSPFQYGEAMAKQHKGKDFYNPYGNKSKRQAFKLGWDAWLRRNT